VQVITCKISSEVNATLEAMAREEGVTKSEVVRRALQGVVKRKQKRFFDPEKPSLYDLNKDLFKRLDKGPGDLSTNKKYLEGFGRS
jgi:Ribbon-helix-helix protein, copG family